MDYRMTDKDHIFVRLTKAEVFLITRATLWQRIDIKSQRLERNDDSLYQADFDVALQLERKIKDQVESLEAEKRINALDCLYPCGICDCDSI